MTSPHVQSSRWVWISSVTLCTVVVLYFLSVPIVWQKAVVERRQYPGWVKVYLVPWMWCEEHTPLSHPMHLYSGWVARELGAKVP